MFSGKRLTLSLVVLFLVASGCDENFLQTRPKGNISEATFWETEEDVRLAVNNLYTYLYGDDIFAWDAMSDIATARSTAAGVVPYVTSVQDSETGFGNNQWRNSYRGIRAANEVLANADEVETDNQELVDRYKAEARFMRAYLYTYLVSWFGDVPLIEQPISLEEVENAARTDKEQVWDFIGSELQAISEILPRNYDPNNLGRITRGAALAMKARAMLYAERYNEALKASKAVMDMGRYSLYPSYEDLFSYAAEHNQEVILNKEFVRNVNPTDVFGDIAPYSQHNAGSSPLPVKKLVDAYEMQNGLPIDAPGSGFDPRNPYQSRDPRLDYSIFVFGDTLPGGQIYDPRPGFGGADDIERTYATTETGFNIEKYVNPQDLDTPNNGGINLILLRYAEVLLTYAEAKIETGSIDQSVYNAINKVRQRPDVDMPPIEPPKTIDELREIVRHERMVELAFEGQRFFDIRRWGIAEEVLNGPIYGMRYVSESGDVEVVRFTNYQRSFSVRDYLWPLPQKEIDLLGLEQNPGY